MSLKCTTVEEAQEAAQLAMRCVRLIRDGLPIEGSKSPPPVLEQDSWYVSAAEVMIQFREYHPTPGQYYIAGPKDTILYWRRMTDSMMAITDHYGWQSLDGVNLLPSSNVRGGEVISPIDPSLLERIEYAAEWLIKLSPDPIQHPELSEVDRICKTIEGGGQAIFRYLSSKPEGVTFDEFCNWRDPTTGHRLTESICAQSISQMLRRHSQKLSKYKLKIKASPSQNKIQLLPRK